MGASFVVQAEVAYTPTQLPIRHLAETIDYSAVYSLVKKVMQEAQPLLETVASTIVREIFTQFPLAEKVTIHIEKMNPPILEFMGEAAVSLSLHRHEWQAISSQR